MAVAKVLSGGLVARIQKRGIDGSGNEYVKEFETAAAKHEGNEV